jgi:rRNA maturation endonuclease Nob1
MFNENFKNKIRQLKQATEELIEVVKIDEETRNHRLDLCLSCEHLFKPTENCKKCGCFVKAKTWLKDSSCPIKKW